MKAKHTPTHRSLLSTFDLAIDGKQHGFLNLPIAANLGCVQIPLCVIKHGEGPTVTLISGVHGDEFDGQIALQQLAMEIDVSSINGTLIIVPAANPPAVAQGTQCSPIDQLDLDWCFPGNSTGFLSEQIAAALSEHVLNPAELVIDLRSGGMDNMYAPLAAVHFNADNPDQQALSEQHMIAFGAPFSARLLPTAGMNSSVAAQNKRYISAYLGGAGSCSETNIHIAKIGCLNVLATMGLLNQELILRSTRMLETRTDANYVLSPTSGQLEVCRELGDDVYRGNPIAKIYNAGRTGEPPMVIAADRNGILMAKHSNGRISQGECIAIVADEVPQ